VIILDTNVVSEPMKPGGDPAVRDWLDRQAADTLYLTATSLSELLLGIDLLPEGKRKRDLAGALWALLEKLFAGRILPFDERAALAYAPIVRRARAAGHDISFADGQIAAVAAAREFAVATRDVRPFTAAGVPLINPWGA
jgi:predicted nucleic acid-binding protein